MHKPNTTSVCVLLPAHNESVNVEESILRFASELPMAEIIVINNASTDDTQAIATSTLMSNNIHGKVIDSKVLGKGRALRHALSEVTADLYLICDCDLTYPITDAPKLIQSLLENNADMVTGDRLSAGHYKKQNSRRFHHIGNLAINRFINALFSANYSDMATGFRVFTHEFKSNYQIRAEGFEFEVDISAHAAANKYTVIEVPIHYKERAKGSYSKLNTYRDGAKYLITIFQRFCQLKLMPSASR